MKVYWFAWPGEGEYDLSIACHNSGIDFQLMCVDPVGHLGDVPWINRTVITPDQIGKVIERNEADLYVLRYPQPSWSLPKDMSKVINWCSELGVTRPSAEGTIGPFDKVAVNNKYELQYYRNKYPGKKFFYLPFGCYVPPLLRDFSKFCEIVVTSRCHYACQHDHPYRRQSIEKMVFPLFNISDRVDIYGPAFDVGTLCGWEQVPHLGKMYKGSFSHWEFNSVLSVAQLCVGSSWNWSLGGLSLQVPRVMSTGTPLIWPKTLGMELEGLERGNQLDWSDSAEETARIVTYYLRHPVEAHAMGMRGRDWFIQNWEWSKNLKRLVEEVNDR